MAIDPELHAALQERLKKPPAADLASMRMDFTASGAALPRPKIGAVSDHIGKVDGVETPIRLYRPTGAERPPLLIFLHGGGFMFGDLDSHDAACCHLVVAGDCAVAAVAYRLAPENPFPAGLDDCLAATEWLLEQAEALGFDASRIAIGGESAGGNLAAVVARRLANRRRLTLQLLVHPLTDFRFEQPSITEVQAPGLAPDGMKMLRTLYLGAHDFLDPNASPELAGDLTGLPPAVVITVEIDPLRDEGEAYAVRLARAGVETTLIRLPGLVHGFMFESSSIRIIAEAYAQIGGMLQRHFTVIARQPARQDARPV